MRIFIRVNFKLRRRWISWIRVFEDDDVSTKKWSFVDRQISVLRCSTSLPLSPSPLLHPPSILVLPPPCLFPSFLPPLGPALVACRACRPLRPSFLPDPPPPTTLPPPSQLGWKSPSSFLQACSWVINIGYPVGCPIGCRIGQHGYPFWYPA